MLYALVSFSDQIGPLNVFRYITFRTGGAIMTALLFVFLFGPAIIDLLRVKQGKGQPIREDGPADALRQEGHADHGRAHDPVGRHGRDAAVGQSGQLVRLDRAVRDARLRRHRLLRRLSQGDRQHDRRLLRPACACWPRSSSPAIAAWRRHARRQRRVLLVADRAVLQERGASRSARCSSCSASS